MATYVNDLRLKEIATGDESGTWGTSTNTNLELIAEAFSFGTEAITTNADTHTTTIADGSTDPGRSIYLKYTGTLDSACTITIGPNTVSKLWFIENGTSGSQNIIISQGSGANVTIPAGDVKAVYSDGAGSGAAMVDAFTDLNLAGTTTIDVLSASGNATIGGTLGVTGIVTLTDDLIIGDGKTIGSASDVDAMTIAANGQVTFSQTLIGTALDISGDIDVDGTTNLDAVDIDGAVDMASTLTLAGNADFNGDLDVDGTTNLDVVDIDGAVDVAGIITTSTPGSNNVRLGDGAGAAIESGGTRNVAIGSNAGAAITTGDFNVAVGYNALTAEDTGSRSTALGYFALDSQNNDDANHNTAVGFTALEQTTTGQNNTGLGSQALNANTTADNNTAVGFNALDANTTGASNTAVGKDSLTDNTTGTNNVAMGENALANNTTADQNTALGQNALLTNTTGANLVAVGHDSLRLNTTGSNNTALGVDSLRANTTGASNVAVGVEALDANTTGAENVAIGYQAGTHNTSLQTGVGNTILGAFSDTDATDTSHAIVIGYDVTGTASSTTLGSGSSDIRTNHGSTAWATVSDERVKKDITDSTAGLSFINDLKPRTFKYKNKGDLPETFKGYEKDSTEVFKFSTTEHGFIAQEVKTAIDNHPEIKDGFKMWSVRESGQQELAEAALIPILVKALQEADAKIDALTARIEALES